MCGIAGIITKQPLFDIEARLQAIAGTMAHRGPDDQGIYIAAGGRVGLANRRLAIRDLSVAGHMPMQTANGQVCITFNGEIYNADELRNILQSKNCRFRSSTDTEVILQGYVEWGAKVIARLRGQFAIAIYDQRGTPDGEIGRLLLARDHMGIKPLYVASTSDCIVFASELKTIHGSGLVSNEIERAAVVAYLLHGSVPNPMTIYRDIQAMPPASMSHINANLRLSTPERYWEMTDQIDGTYSEQETEAAIYTALQEAVGVRLVSDVPLGAFLSGGLDSSAVVALMKRQSSDIVRTCSMVFEQPEYDEGQYSRAVAQALETEHFERVITQSDVLGRLDHIFASLDQPSIDGVNTYFVSLTAHEAGLTVALSGLGGDELFGGYPNTFEGIPAVLQNMHRLQSIPAASLAARLIMRHLLRERRWLKMADALMRPPSLMNAYVVRRGLFAPSEVQRMVTPDVWQDALARYDVVHHVSVNMPPPNTRYDNDRNLTYNWISRAELRNYTHNQLLRDTDVMSMAHSLEVRVPLLDHHLVEQVLRLPTAAKSNGQVPKPLFNHAMRQDLPDLVLNRQDKRGFVFPFATWLGSDLGDQLRSQLGDTSPFLQTHAVPDVWAAFATGRIHWSRLWAIVALQGWLDSTR